MIRFGQNQILASPKTFDLLRLRSRFFYKSIVLCFEAPQVPHTPLSHTCSTFASQKNRRILSTELIN